MSIDWEVLNAQRIWKQKITDLHLAFLREVRSMVTRDFLCHGCGKLMDIEWEYNEFEGVLNDAGDAFHHGCEDF